MAAKMVSFLFRGRRVDVVVDFKGIFGGSTADGLRIDVLKSLVQKGIRRGETGLALGAFVRLLAFDADPQATTGGRSITTNAINRLPVIAAEDVGLGNPRLLPRVEKLISDLRELREESRTTGATYDAGPLAGEVIGLLAQSPKSRLASHARATFVHNVDRESTLERIPFLPEARAIVEAPSPLPPCMAGVDLTGWQTGDRETLLQFSKVLRQVRELPGARLTKFLGVRYLAALHDSKNKYPVRRGWPTSKVVSGSPVFPAWQLIREQMARTDRCRIVDTCYRWYLKESEAHFYLLLAYFLAVEDEMAAATQPGNLPEDVLAQALAPLAAPEWAVDMHTAQGRQAGKSALDFAREGCLVSPEALPYPELKEIYIEHKVRSAEPAVVPAAGVAPAVVTPEVVSATASAPSQSVVIPDCITPALRAHLEAPETPHGQVLCSRTKQPTYLPTSGELAGFVWKGPYAPGNSKLPGIQFRAACFRILGTKAILARVVPDARGGSWCCYPNISPVSSSQWRLVRRADRCLGKDVLVVDRDSMRCGRMLDCDLETVRHVLFEEGMITAVLDAAVLYTGDVGLINLLYTGQACWLTDYDETTSRTSIKSLTDLFAKVPRKPIMDMIEEGCREHRDMLAQRLVEIESTLPAIRAVAEEFGIPERMARLTGRPFQPERVVAEMEMVVARLGRAELAVTG